MENKCKKCGTTEKVNFDGMCKKCYEDTIVIEEKTEDFTHKKGFFKEKKNVLIMVLSIIIIFLFVSYPTENKKAIPTSSEDRVLTSQLEEKNADLLAQLSQAKEKIKDLENSNQVLTSENQQLTEKLNSASSIDELQKAIDEKSQYILNLEAQVGNLTAQKAQVEAQNGILQQQLNNVQKSSSTSSATTNKSTKSTTENNTDTSSTVYITDTGSKYHRGSCSYLRSSKHSISKNSAISQGYTACSRCNP